MRGLCRRMTVLFWALAAVAAAISLVFMEDIRILISCGLLSAVLFLWSRLFMRAFQRELLDFTDGKLPSTSTRELPSKTGGIL